MPAAFAIFDLFAGPGGLGEGSAALVNDGNRPFQIGISVEKEASARQTQTLRAFRRNHRASYGCLPQQFIDFHAGLIAEWDWASSDAGAWALATEEARCMELRHSHLTDATQLLFWVGLGLGESRMANTEWQLGGNLAGRYAEFLVPVIFVPWAKNLIPRAGLRVGDRLLDVACGTGIVARMAAESGASATGGDINPGMLAAAAERAAGSKIAFVKADAQVLPFGDACFDAVICQQVLRFFPDKPGALPESFRVSKPGGRAVFCTVSGLNEHPMMQAQVTVFGQSLGEEATGAIRAVCGYPDPDDLRAVFHGAGFGSVEIETVVLDLVAADAVSFVGGMMKATPVAECIAAMEQVDRENLRNAILEEFGDCYDGSALRFPHSANVVVATRMI